MSGNGGRSKGNLKRSARFGAGAAVLAGLLAIFGSVSMTGAATGANLSLVKSQLTAAGKAPVFTAPGPAFDAAKDKGKTVFNMVSDSSDPFYNAVTAGMQQAVTAAGLKMITYANQGTESQWVQGIDQAIAEHVGSIVLGGITPKTIAPQIAQAEAAGIPVEESHEYQKGSTIPSDLKANNYGPFAQAAQLMADYAIDKADGHAHALIITDNEYPNSVTMENSMIKTLKDECGSGCTYTTVTEPITGWASNIQPAVESALTSTPNLNWVLPVYDSMSEYVVPAVQAKSDSAKVSVASYNGTPFVLKDIADPSSDNGIVKMDVGEDPAWIGWSSVDQALRLMEGLPAAANDVTPYRVFDSTNISLTGNPPALGVGYGGNGYVIGYEKLWGVKS